jgi:hypothetical protein
MRRLAFVAFVLGSTTLLLAGCFGRTGLSDDDIEADQNVTVDSGDDSPIILDGSDDTTPVVDTSVVDTGTRRDGWIDIFDALPIPAEGGGVIGDCARCARDICGDALNNCINSPTCRAGLACVLTTCVGGGTGGFDFGCILTKCFKGDLASAGMAISAFTCVIGKCGTSCGSIIGGLTGGGGGGTTDAGKPPPPKDAGAPPKEAGATPGGGSGGSGGGAMPAGAKAEFAPWTPEEILAVDPATRFDISMEAFSPWANELRQSACEQRLLVCQ